MGASKFIALILNAGELSLPSISENPKFLIWCF